MPDVTDLRASQEPKKKKKRKVQVSSEENDPETVPVEKLEGSRSEKVRQKKKRKHDEACAISSCEESEEKSQKKKKKKKKQLELIEDLSSAAVDEEPNEGKSKKRKAVGDKDTAALCNASDLHITEKKKKKKRKGESETNVFMEHQPLDTGDVTKKKKKSRGACDEQSDCSPGVQVDTEVCETSRASKKKRRKGVHVETSGADGNSDGEVTGESLCRDSYEIGTKKSKKKKKQQRESESTGNQDLAVSDDVEVKKNKKKRDLEPESIVMEDEEVTKKSKKKKKGSSVVESSQVVGSLAKKKKRLAECDAKAELSQDATEVTKKKKKKREEKGEDDEDNEAKRKRDGLSGSTPTADKNNSQENNNGKSAPRPFLGQWANAQLGNEAQQNKFLRLLGGFKKSGEPASSMSSIKAMDRSQENRLNDMLTKQFESAMYKKVHQDATSGLGFAAPKRAGFIDVNSTQSKKFD